METRQERRQRIELLLRQHPDWRFKQIATESGVSRTRVSQIAHELGLEGISRQRCAVENGRLDRLPDLLQDALTAAKAAGLEADLIRRQRDYSTKRISVAGKICFVVRLVKAYRTHPAQLHGYYSWLVKEGSDLLSQCSFVLLHTPRGWFVVPANQIPTRIYISADPMAGPESNWFGYLEAWHLLK